MRARWKRLMSNEESFLVLNVGSSTLKYATYNATTLTCIKQEKLELSSRSYDETILSVINKTQHVKAVGHRVVHGGNQFKQATLVNTEVLNALKAFNAWAPLHQPFNLKAIEIVEKNLPGITQVAHFDTAFHSNQPEINRLYALPHSLSQAGMVRYGFHGLSYDYIASVLPKYTQKAEKKIVVLHLGNGASACALQKRQSVSSTMGFTALDGLMMGTRSGNIDPGLLIYLLQEKHYSLETLQNMLYRESGLLGVSAISSDIRELLNNPDPKAKRAVDLFCHYIVRAIGQLAAELKGLDVLVFTGGIGENSDSIRDQIVAQIKWLKPEVVVIPTDEEVVIAKAMKNMSL